MDLIINQTENVAKNMLFNVQNNLNNNAYCIRLRSEIQDSHKEEIATQAQPNLSRPAQPPPQLTITQSNSVQRAGQLSTA